jgi:hypothetical protein
MGSRPRGCLNSYELLNSQEVDPKSPRRPTYRVPRHTIDSIGIRPIDLTIIDGIETVSGGEGP